MTEEAKKLLSTFEARLRHLIYLHDELKRENAELKQLLEEEKKENERILAEYKELERSYKAAIVQISAWSRQMHRSVEWIKEEVYER